MHISQYQNQYLFPFLFKKNVIDGGCDGLGFGWNQPYEITIPCAVSALMIKGMKMVCVKCMDKNKNQKKRSYINSSQGLL